MNVFMEKQWHVHALSCGLGYAFLIEAPHGLYLVDSGSPGQHKIVLSKMRALKRTDLKLIWITHAHYDHYGSAAKLRDITGALIGVHPADSESLSRGESPLGTTRSYGIVFRLGLPLMNRIRPLPATPPDFTLENNETLEKFGLEARVIHTPGHTPGHTCLQLEDGTVFAGDLLGSFPRPTVQRLLATDWGQLPGSLAALISCRPVRVFTGHSPYPIPGDQLLNLTAG